MEPRELGTAVRRSAVDGSVVRHHRAARPRSLRFALGALVLLALLASTTSRADAQVDFGLTAGPTIADLSGSYIESSITTWGLIIGGFVDWRFHPRWAAQAGFNSTQKGAFEVLFAGEDEEYDIRLSYLEIPLSVRYRVPFAQDRWEFAPFAGAVVSFGSSCEIKPAGFPEFEDECGEEEPGGEFKTFDLVWQLGIGVDRVFKGGSGFGFDVRYSRGTQTVFEGATAADLSVVNSLLDIKFRMFLPLGGPR